MSKQIIKGLKTKQERAAFFAGGRPTVGTISSFKKRKREFVKFYVGKLRGVIITNARGVWKFSTPEAALKAAQWFKRHSERVAQES